jgi:putative MATE family efflux protein
MFEVSPDEIREGPLARVLLALAAPLLVQNLVQVVQQVVDILFLGRLSGDAVAAVGLATPLTALVTAAVVFTPFVGTQIVVSRRVGAEDPAGARRAFGHGLLLALAVAAAVGVAVAVSARPLIAGLAAVRPDAGAVVGPAAAYLGVWALGLPALALSDTTEAAFVGWGDSRASLYLNLIALGVNVALDPILIFGLGPVPRLEVAGAALATVLGYGVGFLVGAAMALGGRNEQMVRGFAVGALDLSRGEFRTLLDVGLPTAGQQVARQLVRIGVVVVALAAGGSAALAAYVVGARVASVAFLPAIGLQQAAQSVVGQNLGAGNLDRAARAPWVGVAVAGGALAVVGTAQWLVPVDLASLFAPTLGPEALALTVLYLQILAYCYPELGAIYLFEAGFNGAGRTRVSFGATLVQYAGVRLPLAVVGAFVLGYGIAAVFWAVTISNVAAALGLAAYYRYSVADGMLRRAADGIVAD